MMMSSIFGAEQRISKPLTALAVQSKPTVDRNKVNDRESIEKIVCRVDIQESAA